MQVSSGRLLDLSEDKTYRLLLPLPFRRLAWWGDFQREEAFIDASTPPRVFLATDSLEVEAMMRNGTGESRGLGSRLTVWSDGDSRSAVLRDQDYISRTKAAAPHFWLAF